MSSKSAASTVLSISLSTCNDALVLTALYVFIRWCLCGNISSVKQKISQCHAELFTHVYVGIFIHLCGRGNERRSRLVCRHKTYFRVWVILWISQALCLILSLFSFFSQHWLDPSKPVVKQMKCKFVYLLINYNLLLVKLQFHVFHEQHM